MGMAGNMGPMGGPNGQMGSPMMGGPMGPPGNIIQSYQGWGTNPQTGGYAGYSTQGYNTQGWGAPPDPPQQQPIPPPPPHQWGNYGSQLTAPNTGEYGVYGNNTFPAGVAGDMYSRQKTGSGAPGSSTSSAKTADYSYSGYGGYADTTYPRQSYQGGDTNQGGYAANAPKPGPSKALISKSGPAQDHFK